jgi:hypothetical protein
MENLINMLLRVATDVSSRISTGAGGHVHGEDNGHGVSSATSPNRESLPTARLVSRCPTGCFVGIVALESRASQSTRTGPQRTATVIDARFQTFGLTVSRQTMARYYHSYYCASGWVDQRRACLSPRASGAPFKIYHPSSSTGSYMLALPSPAPTTLSPTSTSQRFSRPDRNAAEPRTHLQRTFIAPRDCPPLP